MTYWQSNLKEQRDGSYLLINQSQTQWKKQQISTTPRSPNISALARKARNCSSCCVSVQSKSVTDREFRKIDKTRRNMKKKMEEEKSAYTNQKFRRRKKILYLKWDPYSWIKYIKFINFFFKINKRKVRRINNTILYSCYTLDLWRLLRCLWQRRLLIVDVINAWKVCYSSPFLFTYAPTTSNISICFFYFFLFLFMVCSACTWKIIIRK